MNQLPPPKPANPRHPSTELPKTNHSYESANEREHTMITEEHTITTNQHRRRDSSTERLLEKTLETIKFSADFIRSEQRKLSQDTNHQRNARHKLKHRVCHIQQSTRTQDDIGNGAATSGNPD
ncbi:hypothetical protein D5086_032439 [Populus alba]|uniref:Uncharacterized protein n=3 Tax=Populus TaxID=3689 RepID=A0ACC4ALC0_POPAL|nr:hypothetical protein NC653_040208 [Populus alba x Populus x berolinensis]TKS10372.1 hypothetical protein D5086_0000084300 [Populus alba]